MKICPKCNTNHENTGKFCSRSCANKRTYTEEQRRKLSIKAKQNWNNLSEDYKKQHIDKIRTIVIPKNKEKFKENRLIKDTSELGRDGIRRKLLEEQNFACAKCGNNEWLGNPIILELEHKNGNNKDNSRENLEMLCPNCHSFSPYWRGRHPNSRYSRYLSLIKQRQ